MWAPLQTLSWEGCRVLRAFLGCLVSQGYWGLVARTVHQTVSTGWGFPHEPVPGPPLVRPPQWRGVGGGGLSVWTFSVLYVRECDPPLRGGGGGGGIMGNRPRPPGRIAHVHEASSSDHIEPSQCGTLETIRMSPGRMGVLGRYNEIPCPRRCARE